MLESDFEKFETFIFDLDGTIWWWEEPIPGAKKVIKELRKAEKDIYFITNNCVLERKGYVNKLKRFGIKTDLDHVLNPGIIAASVLEKKKAFVIGEGIKKDLKRKKVKIVKGNADAVLVSEDRHVNYEKMNAAAQKIFDGAEAFKTASGGVWFLGKEKRVIGTGAIAAALEKCTRKEFTLLGKPSKHMLELIKAFEFEPEKTILIGDELSSDIITGNELKFNTALVLTGRDTLEDYKREKKEEEGIVPDFILKSLLKIVKEKEK